MKIGSCVRSVHVDILQCSCLHLSFIFLKGEIKEKQIMVSKKIWWKSLL